MAIETDEDRRVFINDADFGVLAVWSTYGGPPVEIPVIYDDTFASLSAGDMDFGQEGGRIQITLVSSDVPSGAKDGDSVTIEGRSYKVFELQPDGTGMTIARLQEQ